MGSGRWTEQGKMAGEPATTVRDMEALRRMGGAGEREENVTLGDALVGHSRADH